LLVHVINSLGTVLLVACVERTLLHDTAWIYRARLASPQGENAVLCYFVTVLLSVAGVATAQPDESPTVPRQPAAEWVTRQVKAPRVTFHTFDSAAAKAKVSYHLYRPAAYERDPQRRFPVVYWLHGSGGGLAGIPQVARHFDAAIEAGKTPPCLVVFVDGLVEGMYVDWKDGTAPLETVIVKDLVPHIDGAYRTIATREDRLLDGFSMGGYGAARLGFKFPEMFRAVSIVGAGPMQAELVQTPRAGRQRAAEVLSKVYGGDQAYFRSVSPRTLAEQNAAAIAEGSLVRVVIGDKDEAFEDSCLFHEHLNALKIPHTWTVLPGVAHDPVGALRAMGDDNWAFYREAFNAPLTPAPGSPSHPSLAPGKAVTRAIKVGALDRRSLIYIPRSYDPARPTPVVVAFHGGGGNPESMVTLSGLNDKADEAGFIVTYPYGMGLLPNRLLTFNGGNCCGYAMDNNIDDVGFVRALLDDLASVANVDANRVYATGMSNGAIMAYRVASEIADRIAAIAPVGGPMGTETCAPSRPVAVMHFHGTADASAPMEGGQGVGHPLARDRPVFLSVRHSLDQWIKANGCAEPPMIEQLPDTAADGMTVTRTTWNGGRSGTEVVLVQINGGGHTWPGREPPLKQLGNSTRDISANDLMWEFFQRHARTPTNTPGANGAERELPPRPHGEAAKASGLNPDVLNRLDLAMQQAVANKEVAGVVDLVFKDGHRGYFEAFGKQDIEAGTPMPKDAIFRLMSMTKPVITVAALTLLDEGKFTLDEPISKHLPEWAEPMVLEDGELVPAKSPITPRMLMSHSSGLYYGQIDAGPGGRGGAGTGQGRRSTASAELAFRASRGENVTLKEYSEAVAKEPLKFHPGTGYNYGVSIDILGRYIEAVAGKPLDELLRERLFTPLEMHDTDFWVPREKASRIAQRYRQPQPGTLIAAPERDRPLTEKPSLFMGGHGLVSTAEDYARFCRMILNGGELDGLRILKPETVDLMFQNHVKAAGQRYGLGGAVDERGGYSWGGANGTQFWIDRTNKMFGVFMVQTQGYRAPTYKSFRRLVNEAAGVSGRGFDGPLGDQLEGERPATPNAPGGRPLRQAFDRLDADGNGWLSKEEYARSPMAERTDFTAADSDGDGSVSFQEAMIVLRRR